MSILRSYILTVNFYNEICKYRSPDNTTYPFFIFFIIDTI